MQLKSIDEDKAVKCSVCNDDIPLKSRTTLICPQIQCNAKSHLRCLAESFLDKENSENLILPINGHCPACEAGTTWITLIKDLSKRLHGSTDFKEPKKPKKDNGTQNQTKTRRAKRRPDLENSFIDKDISKQQNEEGW